MTGVRSNTGRIRTLKQVVGLLQTFDASESVRKTHQTCNKTNTDVILNKPKAHSVRHFDSSKIHTTGANPGLYLSEALLLSECISDPSEMHFHSCHVRTPIISDPSYRALIMASYHYAILLPSPGKPYFLGPRCPIVRCYD